MASIIIATIITLINFFWFFVTLVEYNKAEKNKDDYSLPKMAIYVFFLLLLIDISFIGLAKLFVIIFTFLF